MIDLHCHVLPGIDDGPRTIAGSLALARKARAAGIETLVATPHVNAGSPNEAAAIGALVTELNARLQAEDVAVHVERGAEIAVGYVPELDAAELDRLGLGGGRWLLIEPPFALVAVGLEAIVFELLRAGHRVVLAHPERCPALQRDRRAIDALAEAGVLMSLTAGSLAGRFGRDVRRFALELVASGLVHNVTSDAHDDVKRPPGLSSEIAHAGISAELGEWLTCAVPQAILAGDEIPPRPQSLADSAPRPRRLGLRLRAITRHSGRR